MQRLPKKNPRAQAQGLIRVALAVIVALVITSTTNAQNIDRVFRRSGVVTGKITKVTALTVTISQGGVERDVPVEEIRKIDFGGEPPELRVVRRSVKAGRFEDALSKIEKISTTDIDREEILQEIDFLKIRSLASLALAGQGNSKQAIDQVTSFLRQHRRSYRFTAAIELLGNLHLAAGDHEAARGQYLKLGKAPSPYFKARSALLTARSFQEQDDHAKAIALLDQALQAADGNAAAKPLELEASLLLAVSKSATGEVESSIQSVKTIISEANAEQTDLLAQAYNALGDCYLQSGDPKAARDAFLHVDLLFSSAETDHAKALYELSRLWSKLGQSERAREAAKRLHDEHPGSRWANQ